MSFASNQGSNFSWIPIYTELAQKILTYRARQNELIQILQDLQTKGFPVVSLTDQEEPGKSIPLTEIDPFTFYASFNRGQTDENRRKILANIKAALDLQSALPSDFSGIPVVSALKSWFFPFRYLRKNEDIPNLWDLAKDVVSGPPETSNGAAYAKCLKIHNVGKAKITMGMFWLNPTQYIAWDANNRKAFEKQGIENQIQSWADYRDLLAKVTERLGNNFAEISSKAWDDDNAGPGEQFVLTEKQLQKLWARFHERMPGFTDFTLPGQRFSSEELKYKRDLLSRYKEEVGNAQIREWVESGQGDKAREELSKRIQVNLVAYQAWRPSLGTSKEQSSTVLKAFVDAASVPYAGPTTIQPIIDATLAAGLKPSWDTLSTVLWAMRPEDYFPVKISYFRELAEELGHGLPPGSPTAESFEEVIQFGRAFRKALAPQKPKDWVDVQSFIWVVCPGTYRAKRYWAGGHQWGDTSKREEFINGNFWQIGWAKTDSNPAAKKTWAFFDQVKEGDQFAIKGYGGRNDLKIYYIGEVVEKKNDGVLRLRRLETPLFTGKGPQGLTGASWRDTLIPISDPKMIDTIFENGKDVEDTGPNVDLTNHATNLILYGPPGTGKTYQTVDHAIEIIEPSMASDRVSRKNRFDELVRVGQIDFITFHQSYSYEDFVEGIRPILDDEGEDGTPRYECRPGSFKRLATEAMYSCLRPSVPGQKRVQFDELWKQFVNRIETEPEASYPGLSDKTSYRLEMTTHGNIQATNVISNKTFFCSRKILEQVYDAKRAQDTVTVSDVMEVVARGCHSQLVAALFRELRRIEKTGAPSTEPLRSGPKGVEDRAEIVQRFLTNGAQSGYELKPLSQCKRYVLIIDEINRGNISKIFGELITILESDKRLSNENQNYLVVRLPYSGEKFAVPANLFVLGTMNTADKSIALVDVALRRRFDFEEVQVDFSVCGVPPDMLQVLTELNRRVLLRKDRDHLIGHAYFMGVHDESSFNSSFRKRIIPLLQEYFYNDWESLRFVLGETGSNGGSFIVHVPGPNVAGARTIWQWMPSKDLTSVNCFAVLRDSYSTPEA